MTRPWCWVTASSRAACCAHPDRGHRDPWVGEPKGSRRRSKRRSASRAGRRPGRLGLDLDTETPGTHTYLVTRTPGDGTSSSGSEVTVLVPTRELLVSEWGSGSAVAPTSNASGVTFGTAMTPGHASMSPDRKHLAVAFTGATFIELWLTDIAGNRQRQLTQGAFDMDPDFSPDGRTLAFTRRSKASNGPPAVYLLDLTAPAGDPSSEPVAVPGGTDTAMPSWTPTGDALVVEDA